jgi:hypothetical protein
MTPYLKKTLHKKRAGGGAQGVGPEFKPVSQKKKKLGRAVKKVNCRNKSLSHFTKTMEVLRVLRLETLPYTPFLKV